MTALSDFLAKEFGGRFIVQVSLASVGVAAAKVVDHNFERMGLVFVNVGTSPIFVLTDGTVTTSKGIDLVANGAAVTMTARDDLALVGWEWFGISAAASQSLLVMEILRYREAAGTQAA